MLHTLVTVTYSCKYLGEKFIEKESNCKEKSSVFFCHKLD